MSIKQKLTSRKFWLSVASFVGSVGAMIAGISTENEALAIAGAVCSAISTGIYTICESMVDKQGFTDEIEEGE